jgi:hypothetical protein
VVITDLGACENPIRDYLNVPTMGRDVADAVLDMAQVSGRLHPDSRAAWDRWVDEVLRVIRRQPPAGAPDDAYIERLLAVAARPLPPRGSAAAA